MSLTEEREFIVVQYLVNKPFNVFNINSCLFYCMGGNRNAACHRKQVSDCNHSDPFTSYYLCHFHVQEFWKISRSVIYFHCKDL